MAQLLDNGLPRNNRGFGVKTELHVLRKGQ